jgi:hypothetical protein
MEIGQMLAKSRKVERNLSENMLNLGYFIMTILPKNSDKLSTPPPFPENISPTYTYGIQGRSHRREWGPVTLLFFSKLRENLGLGAYGWA